LRLESLTLLDGLKREENLWTHILTDSLDASVRHNLSDKSLKLRPAMKRKTEQILLRGGYLWDRNRLEKESSTASMT
jgi:hypothetical protein